MSWLPDHLQYTHWWILGVSFIILEILLPGVFFLWMGLSAGVVGGLMLLFPEMGWKGQILWFSALSLLTVVGWLRYLKQHPTPTDQPTLNRRGTQYIGRIFTLTEPIVNGVGRIRVDDTGWKVSGPDLPTGSKVRVVNIDSTLLIVAEVKTTDATTPQL